jgi:lipopolysaccharide transport system ATP-binding protein
MPHSVIVENLSKCYRLGESHHTMLREAVVGALNKLLHRRTGPPQESNLKWALDGVSLEVERGEVVGIIGRNGAGKSTLLKILSRITYPTSGRVQVNGHVGSLLEVGTGFHDELTGRENIYMNGSILGMKKREIEATMDQIIAFADIGEFLDTPIKRYSSGMRMRLGFAVAAHLSTDVLFVDEVLAVGDAGFQKKCLGAMRELGGGGRTILFVSHNMTAVENLCKRTIWIAGGRVKLDGDSRDVIRAYLNSYDAGAGQAFDLAGVRERGGTGDVRFVKMEFLNEFDGEEAPIRSGGPLRVRLHYECRRDVPNLYFGLRIYSNLGVMISDIHTWATNQAVLLAPIGTGSIEVEVDFLNLLPGTYYVGLWAATSGTWHDVLDSVAKFDVEASDFFGTGRGLESREALVFFPYRWSVPGHELPSPMGTSTGPMAPTLAQLGGSQRALWNGNGRSGTPAAR